VNTKITFNKLIENKWSVLLGLGLVAIVLYWRTFTVGFISDDFGFVEDVQLRGWSAFNTNFGDKFFIPVSHFFGLLLFKLTGGNAILMHVVQVLVHVLVSFQLYLFIKEMGAIVEAKKNGSASQFLQVAVFASFIFLIHPYQTEAVVWLAAKSYGYSLLFSILSIRWFFKEKLVWSILFLILAIHTKESGYLIPLTTIVIAWGTTTKVQLKYWVGWSIVIVGSLMLRYIFLGELVGGYGAEVHTRLQMLLFTIPFYFLKFLTLFKLTDAYMAVALCLFLISFISVSVALYSKKLKLKNCYWFIFLVGSLLIPVITLEITSVGTIASDRYSYFALTAIAFGVGYMMTIVSESVKNILFAIVFVLMSVVTWNNNTIWVESGMVKDQFLTELATNVSKGDNILLVNIPDTYGGVYCLRNGIEDYMRTKGVACNIEIEIRQKFETLEWGCYAEFMGDDYLKLYNYPDSTDIGTRQIMKGLYKTIATIQSSKLEAFDKVLIYRNGKMQIVK